MDSSNFSCIGSLVVTATVRLAVLVLAWMHCTMPGTQQALTAPPAALQGSTQVCVSKGSFRAACVCVDPAEAFQCCFESLTKEAESPVHVLLAHSSKQSFFSELRTEQMGLGGSLACAPRAQELKRRKLGSLGVNYFNDKSPVLFCWFVFWLHCGACRFLVPKSGTKPVPSALKVQSPSHRPLGNSQEQCY